MERRKGSENVGIASVGVNKSKETNILITLI